MTPAEILAKAADAIERNGWTQGDWYDGVHADPAECPVCASASINLGGDYAPDYQEDEGDERRFNVFLAFARHVQPEATARREACMELSDDRNLEGLIDLIASWNDVVSRTKEQVVIELRACAANLSAEAAQ